MTAQNDSESESSKMDTTMSKLLCGLLYPIYTVGMVLFYVSTVMNSSKLCPDIISTITQHMGRGICYPSVYVSEKM